MDPRSRLASPPPFPEALRATGWLELVAATIVALDLPTCGDRILDYFVVPTKLASSVLAVGIVPDAGVSPHSAVRLIMRSSPRSTMVRQLRHPRRMPAEPPCGCLQEHHHEGWHLPDLAAETSADDSYS